MIRFNKVILAGRLGKDAESRYTPQGSHVASFSLAVPRFGKDSGDDPDWFQVVTFGKDKLAPYLTKGAAVLVEGFLKPEQWRDRNGIEREGMKINALTVEILVFLDDAKSGAKPARKQEEPPIEEKDLPF